MGTATLDFVPFLVRIVVGEHSIIDGDCDCVGREVRDTSLVGEHSIIDGDCDP